MGWPLPVGIENSSVAYYYITSTTDISFDRLIKQPNDAVLVVIDYSHLLPSDLINTYSFAVDAASNPPLVLTYDQVIGGTQLMFLLSGGVAGQQYNISITVTGTMGRTDVLRVNIPSSGVCDCASINLPGYISSLPPAGPFTNTAPRYFWGVRPNAANLLDQWFDPITNTLYEWATDGTHFFWETLASPGTVIEAPINGVIYGRYNGYWVPNSIQTDAPADSHSYSRSNNAWVIADGGGLPLSGGTLTGSLAVNTSPAQIFGQTSGANRWALKLGDGAAETGYNIGSNLSIQSYTDAGAVFQVPFSIERSTGNITTNNIKISEAFAQLGLNKLQSGQASDIIGSLNGMNRWQLVMGDGTAESGSDAGSDFYIIRSLDSGATQLVMQILRSSGLMTLYSGVVMAGLPTSPSYANDVAAAAGGVVVGQLYRNGSQVMCRIT